MKRWIATLLTDVRLQGRNGFYVAAAFTVVVMVVLLRQIPPAGRLAALPVVLLGELLINCFYFVAGQVLLEKGEGTLEAQVVTPLRPAEYLAAKVVSLTALSLVEVAAIVALGVGLDAVRSWPALVASVLWMGPLLVLAGFLTVSRFDTINEFLFPSALVLFALVLPLFSAPGLLPGSWVYAHPVQPSLTLLTAAFAPVKAWELVYALAYGAAAIAAVFYLALAAFHRFVVVKPGAHA